MRKLFFFSLLGLAASSFAGGLEVSPVHINLSAQKNIILVKLDNVDKHPFVMQLSAKRWKQKQGKNIYSSTNDILVTPPLVSIPPGKEQNLRIAFLGVPGEHKEKSYRLYLKQILPHKNKISGLYVAINIGLPIFIKPLQPSKQKVVWSGHCDNKQLTLVARNVGDKHAQVTRLKLVDSKTHKLIVNKRVFTYILPGNSHEWRYANKEQCRHVYQLVETTNGNSYKQIVHVKT